MLLPALAGAEETCPFPGQTPMLLVQLFLGQPSGLAGLGFARAWEGFLHDTATRLLPDGFTVHDASGQWRDPATREISRERTKILMAAAPDSPDFRSHVAALADIYRKRFHQKSVGILTNNVCGFF